MLKNLVIALSAGALALGVAACGGSSSSSSSAAPATSSTAAATSSTTATSSAAGASGSGHGTKVAIAADPSGALKFDKPSLTAKAGKVTISFTNKAPVGHNFTIESPSGATVAATPTFNGGVKTLTATLKPGHYTFLCTVPGHAQAGMKGTFTVN